MSFGYSVGDFLATAKLTKSIRDKVKESPGNIKDAQEELPKISSFIQEQEKIRMQSIVDPADRARIQSLFEPCKEYVKSAQDVLDEYKDVGKNSRFKQIKQIKSYLTWNEPGMQRCRERIHEALDRLESGLRTLDSQLLHHVNLVVERTAVDVVDTKAGVERTERGIERTERVAEDTKSGVERTEKGVERTERGIERTEIDVKDTKAGVERTELGVGELRAGIERLHIREVANELKQERQDILNWICPSTIDYTDRQSAIRKTRQKGSGDWFLTSNNFKDWIHADRATLLCSGMPGVGKTVLTSFVVSNLLEMYRNDPQTGVVYIYCQFSRRREQTPEYLMSTIIRQILERHNFIPDEVRSFYDSGEGEISDQLDFVLSLFKKTILIIDALDELNSTYRYGFVSQVLTIQQKFNINVYATSRYTEAIAKKASNAVQIDIRAREEDLRSCLDSKLRRGSLLDENPDLLEEAITKVLEVSDGIFLLAVRYADYLTTLQLIGDLEEVLKNLKPVSNPYVDFYTGALQRIQALKTQDTNLASITICWLFFAKRPIRQKELLHALAFSGNNPNFEKSLPTLYHVLDNCAGLVVVDEIHDTVSLFHKSLNDFLEKSHANFFPLGDQIIGTTCVKYMCSDAFAGGPCIRPEPKSLHFACQPPNWALHAYEDRLVQYPLYEYAQRHWHDHLRGSDSETADIVTGFLADPNKLSAACQSLESLTPRTTGLHVAVRLLLDRSLKRHLELRRPDPNVKDNFGRTPLSYAAELNNVMTIDFLIDAGAVLDLEDYHETWAWVESIAHTPLSWAAFKGNLPACQTLLQYGADVNYRDSRGRSALSYAAESNSEAVARFLLQKGGLIDAQDSEKRTSLCWAAVTGSFEVAALLLNQKANIHQVDREKVTPLLGAARAGSESLISSLVARGADVNAMSRSGDTALSRAVEAKLVESVRLLLRNGADVNGGTDPAHPLVLATNIGSKDIVRLLVSAGSNVNQIDHAGVPPLAYAAKYGWTDIVHLFLKHGAKANQSNRNLMYAVRNGHMECVKLLLQHGATINEPPGTSPYCELVHQALGMDTRYGGYRSVDENMLSLLLARGANPNRLESWENWRHNPLDSPLLFALQNLPAEDASTERVIRLLLEYGAETDQVTRKGVSISACAKRHSEEIQDLIRQHQVQREEYNA